MYFDAEKTKKEAHISIILRKYALIFYKVYFLLLKMVSKYGKIKYV